MSQFFNERCLIKNQTREENMKAYEGLAPKYNDFMVEIQYVAPRKCAQLLSDLLPNKDGLKILDMACGTGLVALALKEQGFTHIDGVDPSSAMIDIAKKEGNYNNLICSFIGIGDEKLPLEDNSYDAVTISGGMGQNMVPCNGVLEMVRLVKPGGYVINIFREEILSNVEEYKDRLEPLMDSLEKDGKWKRIARTLYPEYQVDRVGIINIHQVC